MSSPDQAKAGQSLPRLSVAEEQALVGEAQAGSARAVAALIKAFTPLLAAQARKVRSTWLDADEREQAAVVGLLEAIYRFDPKRGTRLATLAAWWMRWELEQVAARAQPLPLPEKEHRLRHKIQAVALRLYAERGERASAQDVALAAGMAVGDVRSRLAATRITVSLDHPDVEQLVADETCNQQDIDVERDTVQSIRHELAAVAQRLQYRTGRLPSPASLSDELRLPQRTIQASLRGDRVALAQLQVTLGARRGAAGRHPTSVLAAAA